MTTQLDHGARPGLLVSVRNATEALTALAGGADVIDVKEPSRGSLGPADAPTIAAVIHAVDGQAPVTAALGELADQSANGSQTMRPAVPRGVSLVKLGLAGCGNKSDWPAMWHSAMAGMARSDASAASRAVAVVYADWRAAAAPHPDEVLAFAVETGCPALLVDTFDKSRGGLFNHWPAGELAEFITEVRARDIEVVLAGSLGEEAIVTAARLRPDLIAVRAAVCEGGRGGIVASQRVRDLRDAICAAMLPKFCSPATKD